MVDDGMAKTHGAARRPGRLGRLLRHALLPDWWVRRQIPRATLVAIEHAVAESETRHCAELRFFFEASLPFGDAWHDRSPRACALDVFSSLHVWDTEHNSGVLIYVELVDRCVEIVADRGIHAHVGDAYWQALCRRMEAAFARGEFEAACLEAVREITQTLAVFCPRPAGDGNELPDRPVLS